MNAILRLPRAVASVVRELLGSIGGHPSLALLSVALAGSLWLFVNDRENPTQVQTFNGAVPIKLVNVPNGLAVENASSGTVRVQVQATASDLKKLRVDDFQATVNLGGYEKGIADVPVDVTSSNGSIDVTDETPSRISVTLEDERSKEVPVRVSLVGSPQLGFAPGTTASDPQRVTVSGAESLVALVDSAVAEVNVTGFRVDVDDSVALRARDVRNGEIGRVTVNPENAHVTVDIQQREFTSSFVVTPTIRGAPAAGYNLSGVSVDPQLVTITGPVDVLQSIDAVKGIATDEISVADQRTEVVRQVGLVLPQGAQVQGNDKVNVRISITPARGEFSFTVVPKVRNVTAGLVATPSQPAVTVTLSGEVPALQALTPDLITVSIDAANLGPGLYSLPLNVQAPAGTSVAGTDPVQIGLALGPSG